MELQSPLLAVSVSQASTPHTTGTGFLCELRRDSEEIEEKRNHGTSEVFTIGMAVASPQQCFLSR